MSCLLQMVKRKYWQEYDIAPPLTFDGDHVALDIPDDGVETKNAWMEKSTISYGQSKDYKTIAIHIMFRNPSKRVE